jgi:hypothetical protein
MPSISLTDLQNAVTERYPDFTVDLPDGKMATFTAILRLPEATRNKLKALEGRKVETTEDWMAFVKEFFKLRAATPADFKMLDTTLGKEPAMWDTLFNLAAQVEAAGEA